jgi:hypothetical protein
VGEPEGTGGGGGGGNRAADQEAADTVWSRPREPNTPSAVPDESALTPAPDHDTGSLVPEQLHDAPAYIPPPLGMTSGGIMPPPDPADVPTSAWITTAPQAAPRQSDMRGGFLGVIGAVVAILVVGGVIAGALGLLPSDKGKVLFGTAAGKDLCSVGNATNTVRTTDPIFFAAVLKDHMDGQQAITFHVTRDGQEYSSHDEPADGSGFDCYGNTVSLGALKAGTYVFEVLHAGDVEATGTLTVH